MIKKVFLLITFFVTSAILFAQQCQNLELQNEDMDCTDTSVELVPDFLNLNFKSSRAYVINPVEPDSCPFPVFDDPPTTGIVADDDWSFPINIPFNFCFFENQYDRIVVSDNGKVSFDLNLLEGQFDPWQVEDDYFLPTQNMQTNAIFGPFIDTLASADSDPVNTINFGLLNENDIGNRIFVINFDVPQFSCTDLRLVSKIMLYESSNVIDIVILEKPICFNWNDGRAIVGIQNKSGTVGYSPLDRGVVNNNPIGGENGETWDPVNNPNYDATNGELWRFVPDGLDLASDYTLAWFREDENGIFQFYSGDDTITISPQEIENYRVDLVFRNECEDDFTTISSNIATVTPGFTADLLEPIDLEVCEDPTGSGTYDFDIDQTTFVLNGLDPLDFVITYHNSFIDAQDGFSPITTLNPYNSSGGETIYIRFEDVTDATCATVRLFDLTVNNFPVIDNPVDVSVCDDYTLPVLRIGGNYFTEADGGGTPLFANDVLTESQTVFIYAQSGTIPNCVIENSFEVVINTTVTADILNNVADCTSYVLPSLSADNNYFTAIDGGGTQLNAGDVIDSTQTIYIYTASGTVPNCIDQSSFSFTLLPTPIVNIPTTELKSCTNGDGTANFDILSIEGEINTTDTITYHPTSIDAEDGTNVMSTLPFIVATGNVWARVENTDGCFAVVEVTLVVEQCFLIIPTGFSPNSDIEINQTFTIRDSGERSIKDLYPNFEIYIYNRYGNEVYSGDANSDDWNGNVDNSGDELPVGTYFYGLKLNDEQQITHRGWVYLQR